MDDYLPLSMLNQLEYCERRFFLMHVRGEMEVNVVTRIFVIYLLQLSPVA